MATISRQLSDNNLQLLKSMYRESTSWGSWLRGNKLRSIIQAIGDCGQVFVTPSLLGYICHRQSKVADAAAAAIRNLLAEASPLALTNLDQYTRELSQWGYGHIRASKLNPKDVRRLDPPAGSASYVFGLISFHRDGYIREAATQQLSKLTSGSEIQFLLIRANDWVPQVRRVAREALLLRADAQFAEELVQSLPLVMRLRDCRREDHSVLAQALEDVLGSNEAVSALEKGILNSDRHTQRACVRIAIAYNRYRVCKTALSSWDVITRILGARFLLVDLPLEKSTALAELLLADKFTGVRQEALRSMIDRCPDNLRQLLETALFDHSLSVRQLAGYYAKEKFDLDVAAFYRNRLPADSDRITAACILGIGEHGGAEDLSLIRPCLQIESTRIQRCALQAIAKLAFEDNVELFSKAILSKLSGVSREACNHLMKKAHLADWATLESALLSNSHLHVRHNSLSVLVETGKWSCLYYALLAIQCDDEALNEIARQVLDRWMEKFNRSFAPPTTEDLRRISMLLESNRTKLTSGQDRYNTLMFYLSKP